MKSLAFNNTVLRDGHQSLAATRMPLSEMIPVCGKLDSLNFHALETWGGATIDAGLRYLGEFPFDRLDALKKAAPKTPHMMLLRGQNIVQYAHFPDDVVEAFVKMSAKHGMDIFRVFDALNDTRNMKTAINAVKAAGKHAQGTICYTSSPFHTVEKFIEMGVELEKMGCDSVCLKDMAGLVPPSIAAAIVGGLKARLKIPVNFHTHDTVGLGLASYVAACDAGADWVDTSIVPFANGTGQPDTLRMQAALENNPRQPHYDAETLIELRRYFEGVYARLSSYTSVRNEQVDSDALTYQVPGGMLSNFRNQLKEQKMEDRFDEVFAEIPVVREALGWIPLVTPTSQIVGVQAMLNVKFGRWKNMTPQAIDIALGYYGRTPAPVAPEVRKLAAEKSGKQPISCRPADLLEPRMEKLRAQLREKGLPADDEHCVIYAMFPLELEKLYAKPTQAPAAAAPSVAKAAAQAAPSPAKAEEAAPSARRAERFSLGVNGKVYDVRVEEL